MTLSTSAATTKTHPRKASGRWRSRASGAAAPARTAAPLDEELLLFAIAWAKNHGLDGADFMSTVAGVFETLKADIDRLRR